MGNCNCIRPPPRPDINDRHPNTFIVAMIDERGRVTSEGTIKITATDLVLNRKGRDGDGDCGWADHQFDSSFVTFFKMGNQCMLCSLGTAKLYVLKRDRIDPSPPPPGRTRGRSRVCGGTAPTTTCSASSRGGGARWARAYSLSSESLVGKEFILAPNWMQ